MKKIIALVLGGLLMWNGVSYAANGSIVLVNNTLVTNTNALKALSSSDQKILLLTGTISDTFQIYEDSVLVKTITLAATSEKWVFNNMCTSYKIIFSSPGNDTASLIFDKR